MKRKLLYLTTIVLFTAFSMNAQRSWDMGNNTTLWPASNTTALVGTTTVGDPPITEVGGAGFALTASKELTWTEDGYTSAQEFKSGGSSAGAASNLPTSRYFSFPVTGPTTVKVWFRVNGTGGRKCQISDGTTLLGELTSEDVNKPLFLSVNYTGGTGTIYVYSTAAINYFKIESTDASLSTKDFQADAASNVYSNGKLVFISNVKSDTQVDVYGISGVLVKSFKTGSDTSFDLNTGIYVVRSKSAEGEKSAKVLMN
ncbi:T9SS type A sorting domain-containing protein [Flavobacterium piscis]|uniref:T9SS type A sorting domain-containing protein n=1 Tax=Flavobacterium piscis TaxID=1114874 RepID=A0ABU1Y3D5_9FLAO|nr:T9SS type A sorting domain-containing protein [Flavobacterium piscis]MDR7208745.1 hypothetical protein [Flavobacterium piscis]